MPAAIPLLIPVFSTLGTIGTALLTIAASAAVSVYEANRAKRKARDAYNASLQDRTITLRSGVASWQYVLGTCRTGGTLLYGDSVGINKVALDTVTALAANRCELVGHYLAEEFIPAGAFPGFKYAKQQVVERRTNYSVTGPSGSITLPEFPRLSSDVRVFRLVSGRSVAVSASVSGTTVTFGGIPAGPQTLLVVYKATTTSKLFFQFKDGDSAQTVTDWASGPDGTQIAGAASMILGQSTAAPATPLWTADHRARGIAHLRTLYLWDEDIYAERGAPSHGAVLRGLAVDGHPFFDPRTATNPPHTTNPILLAAWWDTLPLELGGCGTPADLIDWDSVASEANVCDELIEVRTLDGTGYEFVKRYECNTILSLDSAPRENLDIILGAASARRVFTAGKFRYKAGAFRTATFTITDADVVGTQPITVDNGGDLQFAPNVATATFSDANQQWAESSPAPIVNAAYVTLDGGERPIDLRFPATTDARQVSYLMGVALEGARPAMAVSLPVWGIGEDIAIFDTVQLNLSNRTAYAGRTFEVVGRTDNWDGSFGLSLAEIRPQTWALDPDTFTPTDPVPVQDTTYRTDVAEPTSFSVVLITPQTLPDGTAVARVQLSWDPASQDLVRANGRHELRYRRIADEAGGWNVVPSVSGQDVSTTVTVAVQDADTYVFQLRAVNALGAASPWADAYATVAGTPILDGGTSLAVASLSRPSAVLIAYADGSLPSGSFDVASGQFILRSGTVNLIPLATLSVLSATNCTGTINTADNTPVSGQPKGYYRVTTMSADQASLALRAVYAGQTYDLVFTVTRTRAGYAIVATLPTTDLFEGRIVFNTGDDKLYRYTGSAWTAEVPSTDLTGQIASGQLTDGAVVASKLASQSILARHLYLADFQNLVANPSGGPTGGTGWWGPPMAASTVDTVNGSFLTRPGVRDQYGPEFPVKADDQFYGEFQANWSGGQTQPVTIGLYFSDDPASPTQQTWIATATISDTSAGWKTAAGGNTAVAPSWARFARVWLQTNDPGGGPFSIWHVRNMRVYRRNAAELIVDGGITATKIAANAVTADKVNAGAITAGKIAAGAVTAVELAAGSVTAGKVDAGAISAAEIVVGTITADRIVNAGIDTLRTAIDAMSGGASVATSGTYTHVGYTTRGSVTFTPYDANSKLIVLFGAIVTQGDASPGGTFTQARLNRNGTTIWGPSVVCRRNGEPIPFSSFVVLSGLTGAQTFDLQFNASASHGLGDPHSVEQARILIIEQKR